MAPRTSLLAAMVLLIVGCDAEVYNVRRPVIRFYNDAPPPAHVYEPAPPPPARVAEIESDAGHHWVYYPESDVYHCTNRRYYVVRRGAAWVTVTSGVPVRGQPVSVEYNGPRPQLYVEVHRARHRGVQVNLPPHERPAGFTWVYYPESNVYHCTSRGIYYHHVGTQWVRAERVPVLGPPVRVEYNGPQPFLHVEIHRRRHRGRR